MMHGLILAGGEGARLAADGVSTPKALIEIGGRPQLERLVETLTGLSCASVTSMVRRGVLGDSSQLPATVNGIPVTYVNCETPSSLHTLTQGLAVIGEGEVLCTLVDTVMPGPDWRRACRDIRRFLSRGFDAVLVITPVRPDDRPLFVRAGADGVVEALGDGVESDFVSGGIYAFGPRARSLAQQALRAGARRLREFLALLRSEDCRVAAVSVHRMVDIDHAGDIQAASSLLEAIND